jgi:hypothetical protein
MSVYRESARRNKSTEVSVATGLDHEGFLKSDRLGAAGLEGSSATFPEVSILAVGAGRAGRRGCVEARGDIVSTEKHDKEAKEENGRGLQIRYRSSIISNHRQTTPGAQQLSAFAASAPAPVNPSH